VSSAASRHAEVLKYLLEAARRDALALTDLFDLGRTVRVKSQVEQGLDTVQRFTREFHVGFVSTDT
jgi:hypothetical protein